MFIIRRKREILTILKNVDCAHFDAKTGKVVFLFGDDVLKLKLKNENNESMENALVRGFSAKRYFTEV